MCKFAADVVESANWGMVVNAVCGKRPTYTGGDGIAVFCQKVLLFGTGRL